MNLARHRPGLLSRRMVGLAAAGAFAAAPLMAVPASASELEEGQDAVAIETLDEEPQSGASELAEGAEAGTEESLNTEDESAEAATESSDVAALSAGTECNLTVMGTTDTHGHIYNWDYFTNSEYTGKDELGLARVMTNVQKVRNEVGADSVLLIDNGDAIQGTPLTYLAAVQPDKLLPYTENPMAETFNTMDYDVQVLGNHEFNYGLAYLDSYKDQLHAPLLGANVLEAGTTTPGFQPYQIVEKEVCGETVKVGVLGLVTPGVATWDKAIVSGIYDFQDLVLAAQQWVPVVRAAGADVVIISAHTGEDAEGLGWTPEDKIENLASSLATLVEGVDMVMAGHSHVDIPSEVFHNKFDETVVLLNQSFYWGRSVTRATLPIGTDSEGKHFVDWPATDEEIEALSVAMYSEGVEGAPVITENPVIKNAHEAAIGYVNEVVAENLVEMTTDTSRYEDTPILDLIGYVMSMHTEKAMEGTEYEGLPVIAQTSPFSRTSVFPQGDLTIADVAGLYIYDNTLGASLLDGKMLKDYLEFSARYFVQVTADNPWDPETHTGAMYEGMTRPIRDYNYDAMTGVNYRIDVTKPVGERIVDLTHLDGTPVEDTDQFIMAVNNYRQNGGGGFPVSGFKTVWDDQLEIRQLIIEYAQDVKVLDPIEFFDENWSLITTLDTAEAYQPSLTVQPTEVTVGDNILAWGQDWTPSEELTLTFFLDGEQATESQTVTTTEFGKFVELLTIPENLETGGYVLVAQQGDLSAEANVWITGAEVTEEPMITVTPSTIEAGKTVTVSGENWMPGEELTLSLVGDKPSVRAVAAGSSSLVLKVTVDEFGMFTTPFTIPADTKAGTYSLMAEQDDLVAYASLKVTAPEEGGEGGEGGEGTEKPGTKPGGKLPQTGAAVLALLIVASAATGTGVAVKRASKRS